MRLATVAVLAVLAVGATMGLAVAHRTDAEGLALLKNMGMPFRQ